MRISDWSSDVCSSDLIGEDPVPFAERLVGGYHQRTPLVSRADQLEQNRGFSLILGDIGKVVADQKVEAIKPIDRVLERELAARDLEFMAEVGGADAQHPQPLFAKLGHEHPSKIH